ncbi:MAG: DNA mismatch repair protein MutS [Marinilabiliales bacterium]|nr:MAG: DNA mismatch repair protein MutS [Marinilabiliales bacterium]
MSKSEKKYAETPLMKQYNNIKAKYPDALLLFRVGDFYETFGEDAINTSKALGIVLTKRRNGAAAYVELAGFPHHSLDSYLPKLVRAGYRVAICDQLEDPKLAKKIVKRGVTELVTPGVSLNDNVLEQKKNNFLAAIHQETGNNGIAFLDISTGEFFIAEGNNEYIDKLIQGLQPSEVVVQRQKRNKFIERFGDSFYISVFDDWVFANEFADELLIKHFNTTSLKGFGIENMPLGIIAAGAVLHYLFETHHDKLDHINGISRLDEGNYVWLDRFTMRNLELLFSLNPDGMSLIDVIDKTESPMGARMLRRWISMPLKDKTKIESRLDVVEFFTKNEKLKNQVLTHIKKIGDLERLISKVATARINPRELAQLLRSLKAVEEIKSSISASNFDQLIKMGDQLNQCESLIQKLKTSLEEEPPMSIGKGKVISEGVSAELDELRNIAFSGKDFLKKIQERESANTGIPSLKIGYNNVFGYYLEVTNVHKDKVPVEWHRKQTLTGSERYITEELKEYEQKILGAEEKIQVLEQKLFDEIVIFASEFVKQIQIDASVVAALDCLLSFAVVSKENKYNKPELNEGYSINIESGRHAVIEQNMKVGESFVANNIFLDNESQQIIILTGPNMSGKSALLRQTALIVLMAQIGCFVPARKAEIGLVDKIFTRVGASDNISSGESTFMVEMNETASILNNISNRSLILLDEIGRGTSTYDGISIAWSITEFLHNHGAFRPKVLFATHYHELNSMASTMERIKNYHIAIKEIGNKIIFLRKLKSGGSEHSFGIHVAEMAGMPRSVLAKAKEMLAVLEKSRNNHELNQKVKSLPKADDFQLSFIQLDDPLLHQIKDDILSTNIDTLTPVEALMKLNEIKKLLGG